jgi:divalent metal cation (Fe/Co/Zn/Cd) transporter
VQDAVVAWFLIRESKDLLVGEGVDPRADKEMRAMTAAEADVEEVIDLLTLQMGPREVLVVMDVRFRAHLSTAQVVTSVGNIERSLRKRFPDVSRIFVEASSLTRREHAQTQFV